MWSANLDPYRLPYVVLFEATRTGPAPKVVFTAKGEYPTDVTWPHGLDKDLIGEPLKVLWYCLHLPRTLFDTMNLSAEERRRTAHLDFPHEILLTPTKMLADSSFVAFLRSLRPVLVLHPDAHADMAMSIAGTRDSSPGLAPTPFSALGPPKLREHWEAIARLPIDKQKDRTAKPPPWTVPSNVAPLLLPTAHFTQRAFLEGGAYPEEIGPEDIGLARQFSVYQRKGIEALAALASKGVPVDEMRAQMNATVAEVEPKMRWPVILGLAGVAPDYRKARGSLQNQSSDSDAELLAVRFIVTHRASAANALGLVRPEVQDSAFRLLAQLEDHWAGEIRPKVVWRLLKALGNEIARALGDEALRVLTKATKVSAFTNFPVGLAALPGTSAPLCCIMPVSLLPIQPLTRCLQHELSPRPITYVRQNLRVLIAECLSPSDRIHRFSMVGWQSVQDTVRSVPGSVCDLIEVATPEQLNERLASGGYQILVLSAHGHYDKEHNVATLVIGDEPRLGLELGPLPPFVILSACTTAPRGRGAVTVGDLLLANGAMAVLGTLVPIDVRRNALLMARFFTYVMETIKGTEDHRAIDEIWHRVATSNAVNEILLASNRLHAWATGGPREQSVLTEFMMRRATGRLRRAHVYEDTERVLGEIAEERGLGGQFRSTMRSQGYVPESLLYTMMGRPDRIVVADQALDKLAAEEHEDAAS